MFDENFEEEKKLKKEKYFTEIYSIIERENIYIQYTDYSYDKLKKYAE